MIPMSSNRGKPSKNLRCKASVRGKEHRPFRANPVLAERNPAVVAVGAWVEGGHVIREHPATLAFLTEEIQEEKRRQNEESLIRFQQEVRHRVAQHAQVYRRRQQPQPDRLKHRVWTEHVSGGDKPSTAGGAACPMSSEGMRPVRDRLAACRMIPCGEMTSELPGGQWNISPTRHRAEEVEEEEEDEEDDDHHLSSSQDQCYLVQHKLSGHVLWDSDKSDPDPGLHQSDLRVPQVLWPLTNQEELKRQRQSQFLMHRRFYMNKEREQVKLNKEHRKHLKRAARLKAEKEQLRLDEERKLERVRRVEEARQRLEERELLILERLRLEEEEEGRGAELRRRKQQEKEKVTARFIDALRAQVKQRLSQVKQEPPPLCCCASSFWDSHPDTCANNCVFHNNPKAYIKALRSTMQSMDLH